MIKLTIEEIETTSEMIKTSANNVSKKVLSIMFAVLLVGFIIKSMLGDAAERYPWLSFAFLVPLALPVVYYVKSIREIYKKSMLSCPNCQTKLLPPQSISLIANKRCTSCDTIIVAETPSDSPDTPEEH